MVCATCASAQHQHQEVLVDGLRGTCGNAWYLVLVAMQGHQSYFPAQWGPASHPTLPGGGGMEGGGFAKGQMDRAPHGGHLGNRRGRCGLRQASAIIQGI